MTWAPFMKMTPFGLIRATLPVALSLPAISDILLPRTALTSRSAPLYCLTWTAASLPMLNVSQLIKALLWPFVCSIVMTGFAVSRVTVAFFISCSPVGNSVAAGAAHAI